MQKAKYAFFLANTFIILVLTHALPAGTVTGSPATVETEFIESKCSEEIVDEKEEGEDE